MFLHLIPFVCFRTSSTSFQVDLGNVKTIAGVATQGDPSSDERVKTYTVSYSCEGNRWTRYEDHSHRSEVRLCVW